MAEPVLEQIKQDIIDIQNTNSDLKHHLNNFKIVGAKKILVDDSEVCVIFVPVPLMKRLRVFQDRLTADMEKKMNCPCVFVSKATIIPQESNKSHIKRQKRPHSRTLTAVHQLILEDVVFPSEIVGRHVRHTLRSGDRKSVQTEYIRLDATHRETAEDRTHLFSLIYKDLTGRNAEFGF
eukprot:TRINITY_DN3227_c2_g2_i1.p1 TRINITY_DN3227_c2_g2~~TRINITY_DN3227_c2_g2_i1.p1  ORF type:complete len:179 (+),score=40.06 TRINITY_DN3227_c2_g2_i1:48-584(+)